MNFIEQLLGIAPDAGSGTLEALVLLIPLAALFSVYRLRRFRRSRRPLAS